MKGVSKNGGVQRGRRRRRFQFHDQRQRARQGVHDLVEGRYQDAAITPRVRATAVKCEAGTGIVRPKGLEGLCGDRALPARRTIDRQVVHEQQHAVARDLHVELDGFYTECDRLLQRHDRILGCMRAVATMSDHGTGVRIEQDHAE